MVKIVEKVELPEEDYRAYKDKCKKLGKSLRGQTTLLIQEFINEKHPEINDPLIAQILNELARIYHEDQLKNLK